MQQIKRFNSLIEIDTNINSAYLYLPPFSHKNRPKIDSTESVQGKLGLINFDYSNGKLCGIEILDGKENLDLKTLGL